MTVDPTKFGRKSTPMVVYFSAENIDNFTVNRVGLYQIRRFWANVLLIT